MVLLPSGRIPRTKYCQGNQGPAETERSAKRKEDMTMTMKRELNPEELEEVVGGFGGSPNPLPEKKGCDRYKIESGANLSRLARRYNTTVAYLMEINKDYITNKNDITAGFWMYVPKK